MNRAYFNGLKALAKQKAEPLLLDLFPDAAAAFSLRKLRAAYTGAAIRVRRSSDDAEQDIGFDANNDLDTAALLAFVGAGDGFVTNWYDQSGDALNVKQTTLNRQPRIVNNGGVQIENGMPTIRFTGSTFLFESNILSVGVDNDMLTFSTARNLDGLNSDVFFKGAPTNIINAYSLTFTNNTTASFATNNSGVDVRASVSNILTNQILYTTEFIRNISNTLYRNSSQVAQRLSTIGVLGVNNEVFSIGALMESSTNPLRFLNGNIQEIIIYHSPILPSKAPIEANINNYYNVF